MKKFCLLACSLAILILLGNHIIALQTPTFLAVPFLTEEETLDTISELSPVSDRSIASLVRFEDASLLYDALTNTHFITVGTDCTGQFNTSTAIKLYWISSIDEGALASTIAADGTYLMLATYNGSYEVITLSVSTLPLVSFDSTEQGNQITIIEANNPDTNRYTITTSLIEYAVRGATSSTFDKKPYTVSLIDDDGERNPLSLFGLRTDDDWNLNAVYGDITRIREASTLDLLQQMVDTADTEHSHPQDSQFVELFIDGKYQGIYQVLEPMDTRQAEIDEDSDYLYKAGSNFTFDDSFATLNALEDDDASPVPVKSYPEDTYDTRYDPLVEYLTFLEGEGEINIANSTLAEISTVLDIENLIDLSIANTVFSLWDNSGKNFMLVLEEQDDGSLLARREYFDFNYSFGDTFDWQLREDAHALTVAVDASLISTDDVFRLFEGAACYDELIARYQVRYDALRADVLSEENILATIDTYYTSLSASGAYARDTERWDIPSDADTDYARLREYVSAHLVAVDDYVAQLLS